jgi:hypothetical protein
MRNRVINESAVIGRFSRICCAIQQILKIERMILGFPADSGLATYTRSYEGFEITHS